MKHFFISCLFLLLFFKVKAQKQYQLAAPLLQYRSAFFTDTAMLQMHFRQVSTTIHYTINGNDPKETDHVYEKPLIVKDKITMVKARVFGKDFLPSETAAMTFIKTGLPFKVAEVTGADEKYKGGGSAALTDNSGGIPDHGNSNWLGYQVDSVMITMQSDKIFPVKEVLLDFLLDEGGWIFLPENISVYAEVNDQLRPVATDIIAATGPANGSNCVFRMLKLDQKIKTSQLFIKISTVKHIPDWHPAKGSHAWMFIDEIKVY